MGRKLYPSHALFNTTASFTSKESSATSGEGLSEDNNQAGNKIAINSQFTDLDFNAFMGDDKTAEVAPSENNGSSTGLDGLDWKLPDVEPPTLVQQPTKNKSGDKDNQASEPHTMTQDLDWELPDIEPPTVVSEKPSENQLTSNNENASQAKLGGFEFNEFSAKAEDELDDPLTLHNMSSNDESDSAMRQVATEKESFEERLNNVEIELERLDEDDLANEKSDEDALGTEEYIETKLDLAMAYLDMGDAVGARNLLEEVLQEGNADQKQRAEAFMAKLA
jgi:pilus assembly protein FimV